MLRIAFSEEQLSPNETAEDTSKSGSDESNLDPKIILHYCGNQEGVSLFFFFFFFCMLGRRAIFFFFCMTGTRTSLFLHGREGIFVYWGGESFLHVRESVLLCIGVLGIFFIYFLFFLFFAFWGRRRFFFCMVGKTGFLHATEEVQRGFLYLFEPLVSIFY